MIFLIFCIEEDKFIPEFNPPGIKVEDVYFKSERYLELELGIGNNIDIVNFSRINNNYLYGIYIRKKFLYERLKYNLERFYGDLQIIGETMNPFFISRNKAMVFTKIPTIVELGFSGLKDSFSFFSTIDIIVPYEDFLIGFTGGYRKSIFSGMFLQFERKRFTFGKDLFEILFFSDIYFLSIRYSYDLFPFYDFWFKTDYRFNPTTSFEFLYGFFYLKTGIIRNTPFFYLNIRNSEFYIYDKKIGISIYYSIKNRFFTTRFIGNNSTDFKEINGLFGIFLIPEKKHFPFVGGFYSLDNYWRIFAGLKFK